MKVSYSKGCVLVIDKPAGYTSFDIISIIKKKLKVKKAGHTGTLDKFASGVLVLCTGWTTKLVPYFMDMDKRYIATIQLGIATDTHDCEGAIIATHEVNCTFEEIDSCLQDTFVGTISQTPPLYSAVKIGGRRASDRVRRGEEITIAPRTVCIYAINVLNFDKQRAQITLDVLCSKGTYIRALARDLGNSLQVGAHVVRLQRIAVGHFSVDNALRLEQCDELPGKEIKNIDGVYAPYDALYEFGVVEVKEKALINIKHGKHLTADDVVAAAEKSDLFRVIPEGHKVLVAIA
ncbi:MAG TPA: tRNA pseudouridine(55) synthase TruB, partial [Spirochaetota bacterium]|nr:tRNA pseudouridine(55) synthase TruB [Spirochaetota bacterium]